MLRGFPHARPPVQGPDPLGHERTVLRAPIKDEPPVAIRDSTLQHCISRSYGENHVVYDMWAILPLASFIVLGLARRLPVTGYTHDHVLQAEAYVSAIN